LVFASRSERRRGVAAFNEVCADRIDLLHPHFRKLCRQVADCDEWSQSIILSVLIRYSRTQFTDPNAPSDAHVVAEADPQPGLPPATAASFGDLLGDESLVPVASSSDTHAVALAAPTPESSVEVARFGIASCLRSPEEEAQEANFRFIFWMYLVQLRIAPQNPKTPLSKIEYLKLS